MVEHMTLFKREPVTLDGYDPEFTRSETLLGFESEMVRVGGGFKSMDEPHDELQYSITVLDHTIIAKNYVSSAESPFTIAATIANEFLANEANRASHPKIFAFFRENGRGLNNSKRYWMAVDHLVRIEKKKLELIELQIEIERAEIVASFFAHGVKEERNFSPEERKLLLTEFYGDEWI